MRQHSRITFRSIFRIKVSDRANKRLIGYVGDISETGLKLLGDVLLEVDSTSALQLKTRDKDGHMRKIDIDVVCLWSRENEKTGHVESGFTLAAPSPEFVNWVSSLRNGRIS
jgi:hypothetical protein